MKVDNTMCYEFVPSVFHREESSEGTLVPASVILQELIELLTIVL